MSRVISRVLAVAAVSLAACGGDDDSGGGVDGDDFLGDYEVTSHRENHQQGSPVPCSDPGVEILPDGPGGAPYFRIAVDDDFDAPDVFEFQVCTGPGTGCSDTMFHLEVGEDGLESTRSNTSTVGSCNLYAGTSRLSLDGAVATFEDRQWSSFDVPESDCTIEAAEALIGTPDCQDVVVWIGTRL